MSLKWLIQQKPWFGGTTTEEEVTTEGWTAEEATALAIQPANAFGFAAAGGGGNGYTHFAQKYKVIIE